MTAQFYVPPEQLIKDRAEFAKKGIQRGRPIAVVEYEHGILLIGENPSRSLHKISEIYDRVAFAGVGRFNEFDVKGYTYARGDVTGKGLANAYSQAVGQIFTHEVKPYEIEVLVAELGDDENHLYHVRFDGTLRDQHGFAMLGGDEDRLLEPLTAGYRDGMSLEEAIALTTSAIRDTADDSTPGADWEAAVLDRTLGRRKFRRLETTEIEAAN
jgi:proteasome alpha subunit